MEIEIENIVVKSNPRTDFGDLDELTASIREKGVLEPLLVRPIDETKVELVAGERRFRAAKAAGLQKVPIKPLFRRRHRYRRSQTYREHAQERPQRSRGSQIVQALP